MQPRKIIPCRVEKQPPLEDLIVSISLHVHLQSTSRERVDITMIKQNTS